MDVKIGASQGFALSRLGYDIFNTGYTGMLDACKEIISTLTKAGSVECAFIFEQGADLAFGEAASMLAREGRDISFRGFMPCEDYIDCVCRHREGAGNCGKRWSHERLAILADLGKLCGENIVYADSAASWAESDRARKGLLRGRRDRLAANGLTHLVRIEMNGVPNGSNETIRSFALANGCREFRVLLDRNGGILEKPSKEEILASIGISAPALDGARRGAKLFPVRVRFRAAGKARRFHAQPAGEKPAECDRADFEHGEAGNESGASETNDAGRRGADARLCQNQPRGYIGCWPVVTWDGHNGYWHISFRWPGEDMIFFNGKFSGPAPKGKFSNPGTMIAALLRAVSKLEAGGRKIDRPLHVFYKSGSGRPWKGVCPPSAEDLKDEMEARFGNDGDGHGKTPIIFHTDWKSANPAIIEAAKERQKRGVEIGKICEKCRRTILMDVCSCASGIPHPFDDVKDAADIGKTPKWREAMDEEAVSNFYFAHKEEIVSLFMKSILWNNLQTSLRELGLIYRANEDGEYAVYPLNGRDAQVPLRVGNDSRFSHHELEKRFGKIS